MYKRNTKDQDSYLGMENTDIAVDLPHGLYFNLLVSG